VRSCILIKTHASLPAACGAQNMIIYHQVEKKISVNGVQLRIWKEAFSANLETNQLHLARQKTVQISALNSNLIPPA
jgi:hypothetical protein